MQGWFPDLMPLFKPFFLQHSGSHSAIFLLKRNKCQKVLQNNLVFIILNEVTHSIVIDKRF